MNTINLKTLTAALTFFLGCMSLAANPGPEDRILEPDTRPVLVGTFGGVDYNVHDGEFITTVNGIECCSFDGGTGLGAVAGAKAMIPLIGSLSLSPRVLYENRNGTFIDRDERYPFLGENNRVEIVTFENKLDVSIHTLSVDALAAYTVVPFGLYVAAGPSLSVAIATHYTRSGSIYSPDGVEYLNGTTSMQYAAGELAFTNSTFVAMRGGIGAVIEIAENIYINPEALYSLPLNRVSKQDAWKMSAIQGTLGVMMAF